MTNKKYTFLALLLVTIVASLAYAAITKGGPPTVTVTSITAQVGGCGSAGPNEPLACVTVNWTATVPIGTTLNGFKVTVTKQGETTPHVVDNLAATARTATVAVSATPVAPTGQFTAVVTAKYSSSLIANKAGNF